MKRALLLWLGLSWGSALAASVDRVAAVVNDKVITLSQVYELGRPYIERLAAGGSSSDRRAAELQVLDQQIRELLIEQEMDRLKIQVEDREAREASALSPCSRQVACEFSPPSGRAVEANSCTK